MAVQTSKGCVDRYKNQLPGEYIRCDFTDCKCGTRIIAEPYAYISKESFKAGGATTRPNTRITLEVENQDITTEQKTDLLIAKWIEDGVYTAEELAKVDLD